MKKSKQLWIFTGIFLIINVILYVLQLGGDRAMTYVSDILPIICSFIALTCIFWALKKLKEFDFTKIAWLFIFIGIVLYFLAETTYAILELYYNINMNDTYPTLADIFWCIGYLPIFVGLFMMFIGYQRSGFPMGKVKLYIILSVLLLVLSVSVIFYLLVPIINDGELSGLTRFFYFYYPVADILTVIPAVILMYITSLFGTGIISKPWKYLAFGFICFTIADLLYSYLSWQDIYAGGNFTDIGWNAGYLFVAIAGIYQKELVESFN